MRLVAKAAVADNRHLPKPRLLHCPDVLFKGRAFWWEAFDCGITAPLCRIGKARLKLSPRNRRLGQYGDRPRSAWRLCDGR